MGTEKKVITLIKSIPYKLGAFHWTKLLKLFIVCHLLELVKAIVFYSTFSTNKGNHAVFVFYISSLFSLDR